MTAAGWIFLALSWLGLFSLAGFCFYKILTTREGP